MGEIDKLEKREDKKGNNDKDILMNQLEILNKKFLLNMSSTLYNKYLQYYDK